MTASCVRLRPPLAILKWPRAHCVNLTAMGMPSRAERVPAFTWAVASLGRISTSAGSPSGSGGQ
eukprot:8359890-Alexandrium_andersonii.AAC.1